MSSELVKRAPQSLVPVGEEWKAYLQIAQVWVDSGMLPTHIKTPQQALATMLAARDFGIKHTAAFKGLWLMNGKVQMEAQVMLGLVIGRLPSFEYTIIEQTDAGCILEGRRDKSKPWIRASFNAKDALRAGLLDRNPTYKTYPVDMYFSKAVERLCRRVAPDVLLGICYDKEEMEVIGTPSPIGSVEIAKEDVIDLSDAEEIKDAEIVPVDEMFPKPIEEAK